MPDPIKRIALKNLTRRPLLISLNSRETVRIASESVALVPESEVVGNADVQKLRLLQRVSLTTVKAAATVETRLERELSPDRPAGSAKTKPRGGV